MKNDMSMYHSGNRELQDQFGSRALADRLAEKLRRENFNDEDKAFIESCGFFFLATAVSGLSLIGVDNWVESAFNGTALVAAVALSTIVGRRRAGT